MRHTEKPCDVLRKVHLRASCFLPAKTEEKGFKQFVFTSFLLVEKKEANSQIVFKVNKIAH